MLNIILNYLGDLFPNIHIHRFRLVIFILCRVVLIILFYFLGLQGILPYFSDLFNINLNNHNIVFSDVCQSKDSVQDLVDIPDSESTADNIYPSKDSNKNYLWIGVGVVLVVLVSCIYYYVFSNNTPPASPPTLFTPIPTPEPVSPLSESDITPAFVQYIPESPVPVPSVAGPTNLGLAFLLFLYKKKGSTPKKFRILLQII